MHSQTSLPPPTNNGTWLDGIRHTSWAGWAAAGRSQPVAESAQPGGATVEMGTGSLRNPSTTSRLPSGAVSATRKSLPW